MREKKRFVVTGNPISPGIAVGKVFLYEDIRSKELEFREITEKEVSTEWDRIRNAVNDVGDDLKENRELVLHTLSKKYGDIFDAHRIMLNDPKVKQELKDELEKTKLNAEQIVKNVFNRYEDRFSKSDNEVIKERAEDVTDLKGRVLSSLTGAGEHTLSKLPPESVIITEKLLPSDTVNLIKSNVKAIVTKEGSINSHSALLARSLNIPSVTGFKYSLEEIPSGSTVIVDAEKGEVVINPYEEEIEKVKEEIKKRTGDYEAAVERSRELDLKIKGRRVKVLANINSESDIEKAVEYGCDGIGLYRIEQIYMKKSVPPDESEILASLEKTLKKASGKEAVIRLLDVGGDKTLPYFNSETEGSSFMGVRGVRFLLHCPVILETQIKALLRLNENYDIKALVPMVTLPEDIIRIREAIEKIERQFGSGKQLLLGSMIETPAAALKVREILKYADFISIGTNDLIQYVMASGRENNKVSHYYNAGADIVLDYIEKIVSEAERTDKECILCGELAADTNYTAKLLKTGLRNFSVSVYKIPEVKNRIAEVLEKEEVIA